MPSLARSSANQSNSSGGSIRSTTTVTGSPRSASQRPAHSHPPRCGRARITPCARSAGGGDVLVVGDLDPGGDGSCRQRRQAASSRSSSGRTSRRRPARRARTSAIATSVGLTRRRWRSIIARRCGLATAGAETDRVRQAAGDDAGHHPGEQRAGADSCQPSAASGAALVGRAARRAAQRSDVAGRGCAGAGCERRGASGGGCGASRCAPP